MNRVDTSCKSNPSMANDLWKGSQAGACLCAPEKAKMAAWSGGSGVRDKSGGQKAGERHLALWPLEKVWLLL